MPYIGNITSDFSIDTGNITNRAVTATKLSPSSVGSNGQVLSVDGSGNLQWSADASGTALTGSTNNTITTVTGANAIQGEANLTFNGSGDLTVKGNDGISANLYLISHAGDTDGDGWRVGSNQDVKDLTIANNTTGSYVDKITVLKTGEVGIGTSTPNNKLDVNGGIVCSPNTDGKDTFELSTHAANEGRLSIKNVDTKTVQIRAGGDSYFNGGNVGIGTTSPSALFDCEIAATDKLEYGNNPRLFLQCATGNNGLRIWSDTTPIEARTDNSSRFFMVGGGPSHDTTWAGKTCTALSTFDSSPKIFLNATYWNGSASVTAFQTSIQAVATSAASNGGYLGLGASATPDDLVILPTGKVGIGTTSPEYKLELSGTNNNSYLSLENTTAADTDGSRYSRILFRGFQSGGELSSLAAINGAHDGTADDQKGILSFRTNDGDDGESPTVRMVIDSAGRIIQKNNDEDIALVGSASGQLVIDGNGYSAAIANNATGTFLYNNSASRVMGLGVNGAEVLRCTTTGVEQRFVNSTVYAPTTGARKGHYIYNDGNADGCYASLELAATDADDYFGSTILSSIATGVNYSNDFVIQTRSSGNYGERMRIAHDGATTFSSTVSYTYSTPDGTIDTNVPASTNAGDWVTIIPTGTSGIVSGASYVLRIFWHYNANGNYPYYCAGGMIWVPVASNDSSSPYGNEITLPCAYHDAGFIPSLKVRAIAGSSVQTGIQATTVGWNPAQNSQYRVEYKRIM